MSVDFNLLQLGGIYERPQLAKLWGYAGYQALSRGVVTPAGSNYIILFVTEEKQSSLTQYDDYLSDGKLHWEGEQKHGSDSRIVNAGFGPSEMHLFHRKRHHSPFTYFGRVYLEQHHIRTTAPSQFIFYLESLYGKSGDPDVSRLDEAGDISPTQSTERVAVATSRRGQGVFRDGLFRLWQGCAVTGYERPSILIASHIKPWKNANDNERLNSLNGLLLQPNLDKLFDKGFVTFANDGSMIKSRYLQCTELEKLGVNRDAKLRRIFEGMEQFLEYHRDVEFERMRGDA